MQTPLTDPCKEEERSLGSVSAPPLHTVQPQQGMLGSHTPAGHTSHAIQEGVVRTEGHFKEPSIVWGT